MADQPKAIDIDPHQQQSGDDMATDDDDPVNTSTLPQPLSTQGETSLESCLLLFGCKLVSYGALFVDV